MKSLTLLLLSTLSFSSALFAQKSRGYASLEVSPKMCFSSNINTIWGVDKTYKQGMGFHTNMGYGRTLPKLGMFAEVAIGYSSYRQSVNATPLQLYLDPNLLSYQFSYLHTTLKVGFNHKIAGTKMTLSPYAGVKWLFYLSEEDIDGQYHYVDNPSFENDDLIFARYTKGLGDMSYHTFLVTGGIRVVYPVTRRINLSAAPFFDFGFSALRLNSYSSEVQYNRGLDIYTNQVVTSKGDAIGIEFGLTYQPHR